MTKHNSSKILDLSPGLYSSSGGLLNMVPKFSKALDSSLVCFVNPKRFKQENLAVEPKAVFTGLNLPLVRQLCYAPPILYPNLNSLAQRASLLSCHSFYRYQVLWAHRAFKKWGTPYWMVPHGVLDPWVLKKNRWVKQTFMRLGGLSCLRDAACFIFATEQEKQKAQSVLGPLPSEVVPWPVESPDMAEQSNTRNLIRTKLRIEEDERVLLFFGRICGAKRPLETIETVASIGSERLHLLMIGPCEEISKEDCLKKAQEVGFKNLHFLGPVYGKEKYDYMAASDAYISLSHKESFNLAAAECSAAGLPLILSKGNNLGPVVEQAGAGWYLQSDKRSSFVQSVDRFIQSSQKELDSMGKKGVQLVRDKFAWDDFRSRIRLLSQKYSR